ncbi:MAG TPA: hypothetical protein VM616_05590 [Gammaproteobacteria bacterium]|nr:hypothetical protein [Gammaproteobacteria bacterium]
MSALAHTIEIDLIPADYRAERALLRMLRRAGIVLLALVCIAAALAGGLRHAGAGVRDEIQRLDAVAAGVELQRAGVAALVIRKSTLETELAQLRSLRDPTAVTDSLKTVDRALSESGLWFLAWRFERVGPSAAGSSPGGETAARVQMSILGQAHDHAAVSGFVGSLLEQPEVEDVRILKTAGNGDTGVIDFELLVVTAPGNAPN